MFNWRPRVKALARRVAGIHEVTARADRLENALRELQDTVAAMGAGAEEALRRVRASVAEMGAKLEVVARPQPAPQPPPDPRTTFPIPAFYEWNYWEPNVLLPLRDLCRPGMVAFDVGANAGALALAMSRLVGPRGVVCAFEASPRIVDKTHWNLVQAGCANVQLFHRAVFSRSNEILPLYAGSHLNDSLMQDAVAPGGGKSEVITVALDDFIAYSGLVPAVVKMDIEGAEYEALLGATRLIHETRPTFLLEQWAHDMRCHGLLTKAGYRALDLATYREVHRTEDFGAGVGVANVLYQTEAVAATSPYFSTASRPVVARLSGEHFAAGPDGSRVLKEPLLLPPGRYHIDMDFTASGTDNDMHAGVEGPHGLLFRYHTYTQFLAGTYRQWIFHVSRETPVTIFLRYLRGTDPSLTLNGATVYRLSAFDGVAPPLVD